MCKRTDLALAGRGVPNPSRPISRGRKNLVAVVAKLRPRNSAGVFQGSERDSERRMLRQSCHQPFGRNSMIRVPPQDPSQIRERIGPVAFPEPFLGSENIGLIQRLAQFSHATLSFLRMHQMAGMGGLLLLIQECSSGDECHCRRDDSHSGCHRQSPFELADVLNRPAGVQEEEVGVHFVGRLVAVAGIGAASFDDDFVQFEKTGGAGGLIEFGGQFGVILAVFACADFVEDFA